jgi:predicted esterase
MEYRLEESNLPNAPPHMPRSFVQLLQRTDPGSHFRRTGEIPASLKIKQILVLSGEADKLVPWSASAPFISQLQKESDKIEVQVYEGTGHEYNLVMRKKFCDWLVQFI